MSPGDWRRIEHLLAFLGTSRDSTIEPLRQQCQAVLDWNRTVSNLISKNDEARIVSRHLVESVEPAAWLASLGVADWLDFGSGAGFPAVPLALAGVGKRWTLVESRRPKTLFLRKLLNEIGMESRITVIHSRLEMLVGVIQPVGGLTSRATSGLVQTLAMARNLVISGGSAVLWKGSRWKAEMDEDDSWRAAWSFAEARPLSSEPVVVARFVRT